MGTTITIGRDTLTLGPLIITGARATTPSGFWLPADGLRLPQFEERRDHAPDSAFKGGKMLLAVVLEQSNLPLIIRAAGSSVADLATKQAELEQALTQFMFPLTLDIDGAARTWEAEFAWPNLQTPDAAMRQDLTARFVVDIPINP